MHDRKLDENGDYILTSGEFETTETASSAVRHQMLSDYEMWVGDFEAGRERLGISGRGASENQRILEEESYRKCLKPLIEAGLIESVNISTERVSASRFETLITARDTNTGAVVALK
jgi:phage gp46-like protein